MSINWLPRLLAAGALAVPALPAQADQYSDAVGALSPTAYYRFNEHPAVFNDPLVDSSGNGHNGIWGSPTWATPADTVPTSGIDGPNPTGGFLGLSADNFSANFSGNAPPEPSTSIPDIIDLPADGTFDNDFATIAFFMRTTTAGNDSRIFTTANGALHPFQVIYGSVDDSDGLVVDTRDFQARFIAGDVFDFQTFGAWAHIVVVRNGDASGDMDVYANGVDLTSHFQFSADSYSQPSTEPHIGARTVEFNPGWGAFQGDLDEFAYWNRALTAADVATLWAGVNYVEPIVINANFNGDDVVDGADLDIWTDNYGGAGTQPTGDANGDLMVDGADFLAWQRQLTPPTAAAAIPEPSSAALVLLATGAVAVARTRRR